jgi:hypothetical protein
MGFISLRCRILHNRSIATHIPADWLNGTCTGGIMPSGAAGRR